MGSAVVPWKIARAVCIRSENATSATRSASTTNARTVSLKRPRAPVSVITAAVIVGEKLIEDHDQQAQASPFAFCRWRRERAAARATPATAAP